ncbi:hypothetical protein CS063_01680 [Sporanaerobium hydrogeniformans]|uniref:Uncharacterized protein n=1 Tax=Sporanaerobium hydrogeniformans TaxID=3072179 RepID=A0AC61DG95_9FIRM|nr:hypothetical protein [Sporanaerobium hydrogeniformans]PHV72211.1 hypothetical protein CS063_01680 [Sporanaerobium hydrogeniformans]
MPYSNLSRDFIELMQVYPMAEQMINELSIDNELLLFGGSVREYLESGFRNIPRDFDIVIKKKRKNSLEDILCKYPHKKNRFGGYKVRINSLEFDIWKLEDTWAFVNNKVKASEENLVNTVFLNLDAIVYNLEKEMLYDEIYKQAKQEQCLNIVLHENPHLDLNILRAINFAEKYNMSLSEELRYMISELIQENNNYYERLYSIQFNHYGSEKFTKIEINNYLHKLIDNQLSV